eukprot:1467411-Pyramimonas_sp.AAC.1
MGPPVPITARAKKQAVQREAQRGFVSAVLDAGEVCETAAAFRTRPKLDRSLVGKPTAPSDRTLEGDLEGDPTADAALLGIFLTGIANCEEEEEEEEEENLNFGSSGKTNEE